MRSLGCGAANRCATVRCGDPPPRKPHYVSTVERSRVALLRRMYTLQLVCAPLLA